MSLEKWFGKAYGHDSHLIFSWANMQGQLDGQVVSCLERNELIFSKIPVAAAWKGAKGRG